MDEILESLDFNSKEKAAFLDILNQARILQEATLLEELSNYINDKANDIAYNANPRHKLR